MELLETLSSQSDFVNGSIIPWFLRLILLGLGLSLTVSDFVRVITFPKAVTIGLVAQLIGLPLIAFSLGWLFNVPPFIAVGLVIVAVCPSGVTANALSFAARADVSLCVTLSALTSVITVFSTPFLIELALRLFFNEDQNIVMSATGMLLNLITLTIIPLIIGMLIRHFFSENAKNAVEPIRRIVMFLTICVVLFGTLSGFQEIIDYGAISGALVITMNVVAMGLGFGSALFFKLPMPQVVTITFEVGVQNMGLAFAITYTILNRPDLAIAGLVYAVVAALTSLAFVSVGRKLIATS
jgi:bile acid:Na+ symporter, BASS family